MSQERLVAVVDDDEPFRTALVDSLSSLGYDAYGFTSAEEFVAGGGGKSYDCVISDIHMPGMNGFDLLRLLMSRGCKVPFVMTTACAEAELETKATAVGAVCLLRKPFESRALIDCLDSALNRRQQSGGAMPSS